METPSSTTRRVTRSQTMAAAAAATSGTTNLLLSRKTEEPEKAGAKLKQQQDRYALIDITNDSPIVGLAMGSLRTPSSAISKKKTARTPGSGEALLRGQVKTLLQKVEEEAELFHSRHLFSSPINLAAPTPANTPQLPNLDEIVVVPQMAVMSEEKKEEERVIEAEDVVITRSLLLDFSEKSPESTEGDYDAASVWSIEANASSNRDKDEFEDECYECVECEEEEDDGYGEKNDDELDELCEELSKVRMDEYDGGLRFSGKHIRFVYDDGDEIKREEQVFGCDEFSGVLRLKGLPTPKGKHIWFPDESEGK
ncbi:chalcone-flavanone isomerase family protein [Striga asiatica]|uniref:Chalcone-flavanone isomerase family protein n=1 Tax=Striga asiatica TaxID=4170 RepID=A0A5A7RBJ5_STRAF|nr:chalcone-flavanone isomerase family protein [Striga asiatica]